MNDIKTLIDGRLSAVTVSEELENKILHKKFTAKILRKRIVLIAAVMLVFAMLTAAAHGQYGTVENFTKLFGHDYSYAEDMLATVKVNSVTSENGKLTADVIGVLKGGNTLCAMIEVTRTDGGTFPALLTENEIPTNYITHEKKAGSELGTGIMLTAEMDIQVGELAFAYGGGIGELLHEKESDTLTYIFSISCTSGWIGNHFIVTIGDIGTRSFGVPDAVTTTLCDDTVTLDFTAYSNCKPVCYEAAENTRGLRYLDTTPISLGFGVRGLGSLFPTNGDKIKLFFADGSLIDNDCIMECGDSGGFLMGYSSNTLMQAIDYTNIEYIEINGEKIGLTRTNRLDKYFEVIKEFYTN